MLQQNFFDSISFDRYLRYRYNSVMPIGLSPSYMPFFIIFPYRYLYKSNGPLHNHFKAQ